MKIKKIFKNKLLKNTMKKAVVCTLAISTMAALLTGCSTNESISSEEQTTTKTTSTDSTETSTISEEAHDVSVMFINSGKSDSILVQVDDKSYLIDTGEESSVDAICEALEEQEVDSLDGVFLTHTHSDHIGGLKKLSKEYDIATIYSAEISMDKDNGENKIDNLIEEVDLPSVKLVAGDTVDITDDVNFEVIGPIEYNDDDDNDNSLVLRLTVNGRTIIFAGDMQFAEEATLIEAGVDLSADVLKIGNHGNPDATSTEFANAVSPEIAVVTTDTSVDDDSANERVLTCFEDSDIYITQDFNIGVLLTIDADGNMEVTNP